MRDHDVIRVWYVVGVLMIGMVLASRASSYPFNDTFESGLGNWSVSGLWGESSLHAYSPTHALTDSPGRFYTNNTDHAVTLASPLDLSAAVRPVLRFYHRYSLESVYDQGVVQVSTNAGASWQTPPSATFTGNQENWTREQLDLGVCAGAPDVRLRFRLQTDGSVVKDGWYIDDVNVGEAPAAVSTLLVDGSGANSVSLSWTPSAGPGLAAYRVYRSATPALDWRTAQIVAELDAATTNYTDIAVSPKSTYHYKVMVLDSAERHSLSPEVSATTAPGMDYPFLDSGEAGANTWNAEAPWALSDEESYSPARAWSDSPGTNYASSANTSLTIASPLDLSGATEPAWCFAHRYAFASGDSGNVELSLNGADWNSLGQFSGASGAGWLRARYDLSAYAGQPVVYLRLRLISDAATVDDGWHIDDISVGEAPATIDAPVLSEMSSHTIRLSWTACTNDLFGSYEVYRSTSSGVDFNSTLVTSITDRASATCVATGLALDTEYYFRVYAVSAYGTYSASGTESHARTLNNPLPFMENFEGRLESWKLTGSWGADGDNPYAGSQSLGDSPRSQYLPYLDSFAETAVDLSDAQWPVLRFWDRLELNAGDWVRLEISPDGTTWHTRYGVYEQGRASWAQQQVDLCEWAGQSNVRIRFRLYSNNDAATTADGWNIDEVEIVEHTPATIGYPAAETFEGGLGSWLRTVWTVQSNAVHTGSGADRQPFRMAGGANHICTLAGELVLTHAASPQLVYWLKGNVPYRSSFRWQASTDAGRNWIDVPGTPVGESTLPDWRRYQVSLGSYAGDTIHLRYVAYSYGNNTTFDMSVDDIAIEEQPPNTVLNPIVPDLKSVELSWQPSEIGPAFRRYELYRDTGPAVGLADTLVFSSTDVNTTNLTDTGLSIGQPYYYRLFVVNSNEVYSTGHERMTTTVPKPFGFTDPMESIDNWDVSGNWGVDTSAKHAGSASLGDSPADNYAVNLEAYMLTAVDLSDAQWPVLRFWDRLELNAGDWVRLEISPDGTTWHTRYGVYEQGRASWAQQQVDLCEWAGQSNVRIRFRLYSNNDAATTADGWNIDEVEIVEHTPATIGYPAAETFEGGLGSWLRTVWTVQSNAVHTGSGADRQPFRMAGGANHICTLAGELVLTHAASPQLVYWLKGNVPYRSSFRWQASTDAGRNWIDVPGTPVGESTLPDWRRYQVSLGSYAGDTIHLRYVAYSYGNNTTFDMSVDDIAIEEQPPNTVLNPIVPDLKSVELSWQPSEIGPAFRRYELYRDTGPAVGLADTLVFSSTDVNTTNLTDTGLSIGQPYYYRLFVVNSNEVYSTGHEQQVQTTPHPLGLVDGMEAISNWFVSATGSWGVDTTVKRGGLASIGDSPADNSQPGTDSYLLTAVDLSDADWPVLRFWDRLELGAGDWVRLEISADGNNWSTRYGIYEMIRPTWQSQQVDLSEWAGQPNVRIRFRIATDGGAATTANGWNIDDVEIVENADAPATAVYQDFETVTGNWMGAAWARQSDVLHVGAWAHRQPARMTSGSEHVVTLANALVLTNATSPQLVYWLKGNVPYRSAFRWQVSLNEGRLWSDIPGTPIGESTLANWTRYQIPLTSYIGQTVRLRYSAYSYGNNSTFDMSIDDIGIGEPEPEAPVLHSPLQLESVAVRRPTLRVYNAIDYQGDSLDYEFEVYMDGGLSNLVASVPAVAQGIGTTGWVVDSDLPDGTQYWWRCRAMDHTSTGIWMHAATFYINHVNSPPAPVVLQGPPPASILHDTSYPLMWSPTQDPDMGDLVTRYQLQVASTADFASPVIDDAGIVLEAAASGASWVVSMPLSAFSGSGLLQDNTTYFWRMRASDQWDAWSAWSSGTRWFIYGTPPPTMTGSVLANDNLDLQWERSGTPVVIEFSPTLQPAAWERVTDPIIGTNATLTPPQNTSQGFYRITTVPH